MDNPNTQVHPGLVKTLQQKVAGLYKLVDIFEIINLLQFEKMTLSLKFELVECGLKILKNSCFKMLRDCRHFTLFLRNLGTKWNQTLQNDTRIILNKCMRHFVTFEN